MQAQVQVQVQMQVQNNAESVPMGSTGILPVNHAHATVCPGPTPTRQDGVVKCRVKYEQKKRGLEWLAGRGRRWAGRRGQVYGSSSDLILVIVPGVLSRLKSQE